MTHEQIRTLLDKFWEGETTVEEERALKSYFEAGKVDAQFLSVAPMFEALRLEQTVQFTKTRIAPVSPPRLYWRSWGIAAAFAAFLIAGAWWFFQPVAPPQNIVQQQVPQATPPIQPDLPPTIAAPLADTESHFREKSKVNEKPGHRSPGKQTKTKTTDTYEDPELALEEIKAALVLVSSKLNRGKKEAAKNLNKIESIDKIFKRKKESQG